MEGEEAFHKKVCSVREEALAREAKELEEMLPTPPGMSIADIEAATPTIVQLLEEYVLQSVNDCPDADEVLIELSGYCVTFGNLKVRRPIDESFGHKSEWWLAIVAWGDEHFPTDIIRAERYDDLVQTCFKHVCNMWNISHPVYNARLDDGDIFIKVARQMPLRTQ